MPPRAMLEAAALESTYAADEAVGPAPPEIVREVDRHALVLLDEIGVGTDPSEGAALAQAILERLAEADARVIATTHYNLLKEMADVDPRFENASVAIGGRETIRTEETRVWRREPATTDLGKWKLVHFHRSVPTTAYAG